MHEANERELAFWAFIARAKAAEAYTDKTFNLSYLLALFNSLHPVDTEKLAGFPDFSDGLYAAPNTVYCIRNKVNRRCYIGRAARGFRHRYGGTGRWWEHSTNPRLLEDATIYGAAGFWVQIYEAATLEDSCELEARLITLNRAYTYNILPEPVNAADTLS